MKNKYIIWLKVFVWAVCLYTLADLLYKFATHDLTANPIEYVTLETGQTTLTLIVATLAVTPLRKLTGLNWLIRFRRLLGLFAFFYALLHLAIYVVLDKFFDWPEIVKDVMKRPFITVGFLAFLLMIPLAVTSTAWAIRKMGGKNWSLLHRAIYISAVAGVVHFWWKVKADYREPAIFAVIVAVLLAYRIAIWARSRIVARPAAAPKTALVGE